MSLDEVSAYLRIPQHRRNVTNVPVSAWNVSEDEQLRRGQEARSRLRRIDPKPKRLLLMRGVENSETPSTQPVTPVENWTYHAPAPYEIEQNVLVVSGEPRPLYPVIPYDCPMWKRILLETCNRHRITFKEIISPRRNRHIVMARNEAMWRMKMETSMSFPAIGKRCGGRDHTTALWGIRQHEKRLANGLG